MKRDFVSYADILALYFKRPKGYYDKMACNSHLANMKMEDMVRSR